MSRWTVPDKNGGAVVRLPCRGQVPLPEKFLHEIMDVLVLLAWSDSILSSIIDPLTLNYRLLNKPNLLRNKPGPQSYRKVLRRHQPFRVTLQSMSEISLHP